MVASKRQLDSKFNWFAVAIIVLSQMADLLKDEVIIEFLGKNIGWVGGVIGIVIFILRQYTKMGVTWGTDKSNLEILDEHEDESI